MCLKIQPQVLSHVPGLVVLCAHLKLSPSKYEVVKTKELLNHFWAERQNENTSSDLLKDPELQPWIELWSTMGVSLKNHPPSIFSLMRRVSRGGSAPSIHPIVDCYNALSMELKLPFGAFDMHEIQGGLELRLSPGGEGFLAIGCEKIELTHAGELVYADRETVLTRHFLWRQSERARVREETKECILLCELLPIHLKNLKTIRAICERRIKECLQAESIEWYLRP